MLCYSDFILNNLTELILSWQLRFVARAMLRRWHDVSKKALQTCAIWSNVNNNMARSKVTDVAIMMAERQRPNSGDGLTAVSASREQYDV